jgi:hypothetical protein
MRLELQSTCFAWTNTPRWQNRSFGIVGVQMSCVKRRSFAAAPARSMSQPRSRRVKSVLATSPMVPSRYFRRKRRGSDPASGALWFVQRAAQCANDEGIARGTAAPLNVEFVSSRVTWSTPSECVGRLLECSLPVCDMRNSNGSSSSLRRKRLSRKFCWRGDPWLSAMMREGRRADVSLSSDQRESHR